MRKIQWIGPKKAFCKKTSIIWSRMNNKIMLIERINLSMWPKCLNHSNFLPLLTMIPKTQRKTLKMLFSIEFKIEVSFEKWLMIFEVWELIFLTMLSLIKTSLLNFEMGFCYAELYLSWKVQQLRMSLKNLSLKLRVCITFEKLCSILKVLNLFLSICSTLNSWFTNKILK